MRSLLLLVVSAVLISAQGIPPGVFSGKLHGISKKEITIENEDGNLVDFYLSRKTRVLRGKKEIHVSDLKNGEEVTIEAKQEMGRFLNALTITAHDKPPER